MKKTLLLSIAVLLACCLTAGAIGGLWFYLYTITPADKQRYETAVVLIPKGSSVEEIGRILDKQGLIHYDLRFLLLVRLKKSVSRLKAGEFVLQTGQKPAEVIDSLVRPKEVQHSVTIPEGLKYTDIIDIFVEQGWGKKEKYLQLFDDRKFIDSLGLAGSSNLEGFLFPDTYNLTIDMHDARLIVSMMVRQFKRQWQELTGEPYHNQDDLADLTLASMVEKEAVNDAERGAIAGVFLNRLQRKMRLQSDPTVVYGLKDFSGRITRSNLKDAHPYNTYVIKGLPPGPICSPGRKSIAAVLNPEQHDFLYFVAKNNGYHHFSKNLREHNQAVYKYQRRKKKP